MSICNGNHFNTLQFISVNSALFKIISFLLAQLVNEDSSGTMRSNRFFLSVLQICAVLGLEEAPDDTDLYPPLVEDDVLGCPEGIKCVPKIQCPIHLHFAGYEKPQYCTISPGGKKGYCCPNEIAQERGEYISSP